MMTPTVSRFYKFNLQAIFKGFYMNYSLLFIFIFFSHLAIVLLKKLLTGFLDELQPSLRTYTLLLPAHY
jgi:hypothetical protein